MSEGKMLEAMEYLQSVADDKALRRPIRRQAGSAIEAIHDALCVVDGAFARGHIAGVSDASARIQDLLEANNRYLERARASEEETKRLRRVLHAIDEMSATKDGNARVARIRELAFNGLAGGDVPLSAHVAT